VKFLFDQNLSPRLATRLADLDRALDLEVWEYTRKEGYVLVTRDVDFIELSTLRGFPPQVVRIRRGNCSTSDIESLLRLHSETIELLDRDPNIGVIELV
jgi:predicted nuclease of predicted toxin-antitoxin system